MEEFVTLEYLGALGGCAVIVTIITQVMKQFVNLNPKWWVLIASVAAITVRQIYVIGDVSAYGIIEAAVNLFLCIAASSGAYSYIVKPVEKRLSAKAEMEDNHV